jgi:hypothetical protein
VNTEEVRLIGGKPFKVFVCDWCGVRVLDWEVFQTGWPDNPQEWCMFPDHRPGKRDGLRA